MSEQVGIAVNRTVRFPRSISQEARASLEAFASGRGPLGERRPFPPPEDREAWEDYQRTAKAMIDAISSQMMAQFSGSVETVSTDGVIAHVATPGTPFNHDHVYLDIHGGALVIGDGDACKAMAANAAGLHGVKVYSVDYRMPPEDYNPGSSAFASVPKMA
jgi:monoterpene epsilon-lactone hydrolase